MGYIPSTSEAGDLQENIADLSSFELIGKVKQCSEKDSEKGYIRFNPIDSIRFNSRGDVIRNNFGMEIFKSVIIIETHYGMNVTTKMFGNRLQKLKRERGIKI